MQRIRKAKSTAVLRAFPILFFLVLIITGFSASAQQNFYDTDLLPASFHESRRAELRKKLQPNSIAFVFANPVRNRTNDVDYQYIFDPDLYYLTGLMEPNAVLMISNTNVMVGGKETNEALFIMGRDSAAEVWTGRQLDITEAGQKLGVKMVFSNTEFSNSIPDLNSFDKVMAKFPTDIRESKSMKAKLGGLVWSLKQKAESQKVEISSAVLLKQLASLREIKSKQELDLMQRAINITCEGMAEVMRAAKPGMTEYQAQAIVEFYFKYRGAESPGYGSISGGGENSCVLHYVTNRKKLGPNDMLLMDMGAEYHGYTADVTRTIPMSGTFSAEQKAVYELVLKAQLAAIDLCVKGSGFYDPHQKAFQIIADGLVELGIIKDRNAARRYFNHGSSHYLGLEVHDAGNYGPLLPNQVITIEPGIYIPPNSPCDKKWWNIGIRIEDDILITEYKPVVMSSSLPKTVLEIEKLMAEPSLFDSLK